MIKYLFAIQFIIMALLISCGDKEEETVTNYFKVDNQSYTIKDIQLICNGQAASNLPYQLVLVLVSPGVSFETPDSLNEAVSGNGHVMFLYLNAADSTIHKGDTYLSGLDEEVNSFEGEYYINWNIADDQTDYYAQIASGELNIEANDNQYIFTLTGKDEFNEEVSVYYQGKFSYLSLK